MGKMLKIQRDYINKRVSEVLESNVKNAIKRLSKNSYIKSVVRHSVRHYTGEAELQLNFIEPFGNKDVCGAKAMYVKQVVSNLILPHSWYEAEQKKGNCTIELDIKTGCGVGKPRAIVEFKNEEKALRALRTKERPKIKTRFDNTHAAVDELRLIQMEINKLMTEHMDTLMLGDEPTVLKALADISKNIAKIVA